MKDLRIGAAILQEAVDLEVVKQQQLERSKKEEKAAAAAVTNNVGRHCANILDSNDMKKKIVQIKLAFLDDRKTKMLRDQRDRETREARMAAAAREAEASSLSPASSPIRNMPGTGHTLVTLRSDVTMDSPPGYHEDDDESNG
jgi:hypothetical protein